MHSLTKNRSALPWLALAALLIWSLLIASTWSRVPFWPDAGGYTSHVAEGRWVAHPPGYLFFVALGRFWHAAGLPPYPSVEAASLLLTVLSWPVLYALFRRVCGATESLWLVILFAFSWNVLLLSRTGTSHAGDFLSVSLLLLIVTSHRFREGRPRAFVFYGLAIVLCCGLRLTTGIMLVPFFALVLFRHRRRMTLWIAYAVAGLLVVGMQLWIIHLSGGWLPYHAYTQSLHGSAIPSSIVLSGVNRATLLNVARTLAWAVLGVSMLPLVVFGKKRCALSLNQREILLYGGVSVLGCLAACAFYVCTHPGYVSPALPGSFAVLAVFLSLLTHPVIAKFLMAATLLLNIGFFLLVHPIAQPSTPAQAAANGLLLQYTGAAVRASVFKTTSGWLHDAGHDDLIPTSRRNDLDSEAARMENP